MKAETYYEVQCEETARIREVLTRMWVRVSFVPRYSEGEEALAVDRMNGLVELTNGVAFRVAKITSEVVAQGQSQQPKLGVERGGW
jgi:hypothetical protein